MAAGKPACTSIQFATFELSAEAGELRKHGVRIKLQDQPLRVLTLLVERAGDLVSKEELRRRLWPSDTFVDFDHGLHSAITRLREALGDSSENPRYIETVPRRGYRFIAAVRLIGNDGHPEPPSKQNAFCRTEHPQISAGPTRNAKRRMQQIWVTAAGVLLVTLTWFVRDRISKYRALAEPRIYSVAVLPLTSLSDERGDDYFADGMTAELITELAKIESLRVISRTSAMRYKRTSKPLGQIARELKVDAVVEGQVLHSERRLRITAQLIQTATDKHLWAEAYERDLRDAVELQGEVAESIARAIRIKVTREEHARLAGSHRVNAEAYEAYLKGRFFWNKRTESGLKKSIEYFQLAIKQDPGYALAYSGLADAYNILAAHAFVLPKDGYSKAKAAANDALKLDDTLGEAHTVLGDVMYDMDWDWHGAEREFERAIELSPGQPTCHQRYSLLLMLMGRTEESLTEIRRARALDPLSLAITSSLGWRLLWARRYDEAIGQLQKALEMDPSFGRTHLYLGWAYEAKGDFEKAIAELRTAALSDSGSQELASLGHAYGRGGYIGQAKSTIKDLEDRSRRSYVPPYDMAIVYAGLGQKDRAFEWLTKSCNNRDEDLVSLKADLELDNLRSDPRFQDMLRCVGLAQ